MLTMEDFNIYTSTLYSYSSTSLFFSPEKKELDESKNEKKKKKIYTRYACHRVSLEGDRERGKTSHSVFASPRTDR